MLPFASINLIKSALFKVLIWLSLFISSYENSFNESFTFSKIILFNNIIAYSESYALFLYSDNCSFEISVVFATNVKSVLAS